MAHQVDPKKRITVQHLLNHPWLMQGFSDAVQWQSKYPVSTLVRQILKHLLTYYRPHSV